MHILSTIFRRLRDWLIAVDRPADTTPTLFCWADLPPHHPHCD